MEMERKEKKREEIDREAWRRKRLEPRQLSIHYSSPV
jgi:hypothetical protein